MENKYCFKTFHEQINLLKSRNLIISNKRKLKNYLIKYNYENLINCYNKFFFYNEQTKRYRDGVTSCGIINLFNYDRKISLHILNDILDIEREIATAIVYLFPLEYKEKFPEMEYGRILMLSDEEGKQIFPREKYKNKTDDSTKKYSTLPKDVLYKYSLIENATGMSKFNSIEEVPIGTLSIHWTFGTLLDIIQCCDISFTEKVIKYVFRGKQGADLTHYEFIAILEMFKKIRNRICHNNIIYSFHYKHRNDPHIYRVLSRYCNINENSIRLHSVLCIMDLFRPKNGISKKIFYEGKQLKKNGKEILISSNRHSNDPDVYDIIRDYSQLK